MSRASCQSCRGDVRRRVARRARREGEREQLILRGEIARAQPPDVFGVIVRAVGPPLLRADRDAVRVDGADARFGQAADRLVRVIGRVVDVRPVQQRRDAGVERLERADQVGGVDVVGAVLRADVVQHAGEVFIEGAAREDASHRRLPGVPVRVDESRHDDAVGRVDDFGVAGLDRAADRLDRGRSRSGRRRRERRRWRGRA